MTISALTTRPRVGDKVSVDDPKYPGVWTDRINVAKLGGDGGRYVRITRRGLTKVEPGSILRDEFS